MAEGIIRHLFGDRCEVYSAGTEPSHVNENAIAVMKEIDLDISGHSSKHVDDLSNIEFDLVITVCDNAKESCPTLFGKHDTLHWTFEDPVNKDMDKFREVRDKIFSHFETRLGDYL